MDQRELVGFRGLHGSGTRWGQVARCCECGNKHSGAIIAYE